MRDYQYPLNTFFPTMELLQQVSEHPRDAPLYRTLEQEELNQLDTATFQKEISRVPFP